MIFRTSERPIQETDIELGSLITVRINEDIFQDFMVVGCEKRAHDNPVITGLKIFPAGYKEKYAYYLCANNVVLLNRKSMIELEDIVTVKARLAKDIVANIIEKENEYQKQKMERRKAKHKVKVKKTKMHRSQSKPYHPEAGTNTAWHSLRYAPKGFIHIYRG